MKKIIGCRHEQDFRHQAMQAGNDKNLARHIAECAECRESKNNYVWMQKFYEQTPPPQNLPATGFLLFKARLVKKQTAATRALQPIVWMQFVAAVLLVLSVGWWSVKSKMPINSIIKETFLSFLSVAPLFIFGVICAAIVCLAFAYFLGETKKSNE